MQLEVPNWNARWDLRKPSKWVATWTVKLPENWPTIYEARGATSHSQLLDPQQDKNTNKTAPTKRMRFSSWIGSGFLLFLGTSSSLATSGNTEGISVGEPEVGTIEWEAKVLKKYIDANGSVRRGNDSPRVLFDRAVPAGITVFAEPPDGELGGPIVCDFTYRTATATFMLDAGSTVLAINCLDSGGYQHIGPFSLVRASDVSGANIIANPNFNGLSPWTVSGPGYVGPEGYSVHVQSLGQITTISQTLSVLPFELYTLSFEHFCSFAPAVLYVTVNGITQTPGLLHLDPSTDTGPSTTDSRTNVENPILAGSALPSSTIIIFVNGAAIGVAMSLADGTFTYQLPILSGSNTISASTFFLADLSSSPLATPITVIIDPDLSINIDSASDDGLPGDGITTQQSVNFYGSGPINSVLAFSDNDGSSWPVVTGAAGTWLFIYPASIGTHTVQIADFTNIYADDAPKSLTFTVVGVPDPPMLLALSAGSDTGIIGDFKTTDITPSIIGSANPNALINLIENGVPVGSGNADGSGDFSITLATLSPGQHTIVGTQTTTDGFVSVPSTGFILTILLNAPTLLDITSATDTGTLGDLETTDLNPAIVGNGLADAQIILFRDGSQVGSGNSDNLGGFTVASSLLPGPGQYSFLAMQVSSGGLDSELSDSLIVTIVPTPPVLQALTLESDTGTPGDLETADTTPTIIGTAAPDASLVLFLENQQIGTGLADNSGDFLVTTSALGPPGVYAITARQTVEGFESELSQPFTITILPEAPILDGVDPSSGTNDDGFLIASSRTPAIEGSALANANIIIFEGSRIAGSGQTDSNGRFAITTNTEIALGVHTFTALAWTFEGLMSLRSLPFSIDVVDPEPSSSSFVPSSTSDIITSTIEASSTISSSTIDITSSSIESSITTAASMSESSFTTSDISTSEPSSSDTQEALSGSSFVSATAESSFAEFTTFTAETSQVSASSGVTSSDITSTYSGTATATGEFSSEQETSQPVSSTMSVGTAETISTIESTASVVQTSSSEPVATSSSAISIIQPTTQATTTEVSETLTTTAVSSDDPGVFSSFSRFLNTSSMASSNLPTTTLENLPTTTDQSQASSTVQSPSLTSPTSTSAESTIPSSPAGLSFFLTVQTATGLRKRQTQGQTYLSLVGNELVATQSCVELPPAELVINNGRLQAVSGSVITVSPSVVASPGYSILQFDTTSNLVNIQTTFAVDPVLTWSNPTFLNSQAQFCLLGNVLQATYSVSVASIPGCIPVILTPSNDGMYTLPLPTLTNQNTVCSTSSESSLTSATQPAATGFPLASSSASVVIGIEITIEISIIYINIEINGSLGM